MHGCNRWLGLSKLTISISFFQAATVMPSNYDVNLPDWYHSWMKAFEWLQFDWTRLFLPDVCLGSFYNRMLAADVRSAARPGKRRVASVDGGLRGDKALLAQVHASAQRYGVGDFTFTLRIRFCTETPG